MSSWFRQVFVSTTGRRWSKGSKTWSEMRGFTSHNVNSIGLYSQQNWKSTQFGYSHYIMMVLMTNMLYDKDFKVKSNCEGKNEDEAKRTKTFDFIIIGNGRAGKSAVNTLIQQQQQKTKYSETKKLRIGVVDMSPHLDHNNNNNNNHNNGEKNSSNMHCLVEYLPNTKVTGIHLQNRTLSTSNNNNDNNNKEEKENLLLQYKHGVLISTGVRGASPPIDCLDPSIQIAIPNSKHQILHTGTNESITTAGNNIAILGTSWEALQMVVQLSHYWKQKTKHHQKQISNIRPEGEKSPHKSTNGSGGKIVWMYGRIGPLSHILPPYLSMAIAKHLSSNTNYHNYLNVYNRTLLRYVQHDRNLYKKNNKLKKNKGSMTLYMTPWADTMDTVHISNINGIIVAPVTDEMAGTARLSFATTNDTSNPGNKKKAWSEVVLPYNSLVCCQKDGRLVVNSQYSAGYGVFAAGSVAVMPSASSGNWQICGPREKSIRSGKLAALQMLSSSSSTNLSTFYPTDSGLFNNDNIHIFRSDELFPNHGNSQKNDILARLAGINLLSVGDCHIQQNAGGPDCNMVTHGFWWTNTKLKRRASTHEYNYSTCDKPVFGHGVLFYLHPKTGQICGICTWGLPYTEQNIGIQNNTNTDKLNNKLVSFMKQIIQTNGQNLVSSNYYHNHDEPLSVEHLQKASERIVQLAYSTTDEKNKITHSTPWWGKFRPLHKYTPSKLSSHEVNSYEGHLFVHTTIDKSHDDKDGDKDGDKIRAKDIVRPPSLQYTSAVQFFPNWSAASTTSSENHSCDNPYREELLWLRSPNAYHNYAQFEAMKMLENLKSGKFKNGEEAVKQAPVPSSWTYLRNTIQRNTTTKEENSNDQTSTVNEQ